MSLFTVREWKTWEERVMWGVLVQAVADLRELVGHEPQNRLPRLPRASRRALLKEVKEWFFRTDAHDVQDPQYFGAAGGGVDRERFSLRHICDELDIDLESVREHAQTYLDQHRRHLKSVRPKPPRRLTPEDVIEIRARAARGEKALQIAQSMAIPSVNHVRKIIAGKRWRYVA
jgi:hypothetical protein